MEQLRFTKLSSTAGKDSVTVSIQARIHTQSINLKDQARRGEFFRDVTRSVLKTKNGK